jgi:hypothetical protein
VFSQTRPLVLAECGFLLAGSPCPLGLMGLLGSGNFALQGGTGGFFQCIQPGNRILQAGGALGCGKQLLRSTLGQFVGLLLGYAGTGRLLAYGITLLALVLL